MNAFLQFDAKVCERQKQIYQVALITISKQKLYLISGKLSGSIAFKKINETLRIRAKDY
jgi:hypothetical protein